MNYGKYTLLLVMSVILFTGSLAYTVTKLINIKHFADSLPSPVSPASGKNDEIPLTNSGSKKINFEMRSLTNIFSPKSGMSVKSRLKSDLVLSTGELQETDSFRLTGTIFSPEPGLRRAIIFVKNERAEKYLREGDTFLDGYKIVKIERRKIVVEHGGTLTQIGISPPEKKVKTRRPIPTPFRRSRTKPAADKNIKVTKLDDTSFAVDERTVDYLTENINKLISHVRIIPYFESGKPAGFRLAAIRPGSEFSMLGFSPGDIIKKVNGIPLTSPEKIYTIFQNLKDERKIEVDILRRGKRITLEYEIR